MSAKQRSKHMSAYVSMRQVLLRRMSAKQRSKQSCGGGVLVLL
jgi:hypothetical protein